MSDDIHICGRCRKEYRDIESFLAHKNACNAESSEACLTVHSQYVSYADTSGEQQSSVEGVYVGSNAGLVTPDVYQGPHYTSSTLGFSTSHNAPVGPSQIVSPYTVLGQSGPSVLVQPEMILQPISTVTQGFVPFVVKNGNMMCVNVLDMSKVNQSPGQSTSFQVAKLPPAVSIVHENPVPSNRGDAYESSQVILPMDGMSDRVTHNDVMAEHSEPMTEERAANRKTNTLIKVQKTNVNSGQNQMDISSDADCLPRAVAIENAGTYEGQILSVEPTVKQEILIRQTEACAEQYVEQALGEVETGLVQVENQLEPEVEGVCTREQAIEGQQSNTAQSIEVINSILDESMPSNDPLQNVAFQSSSVNSVSTMTSQQSFEPVTQLNPGVSATKTSVKTTILSGLGSIRLMTSVPKKLECSRCPMKFPHKKDLDRHFRVHTGDRPFACQFCDKKFSRSDKRKIHERTHTGDKPYKCQECDYSTVNSTSLKQHTLVHQNIRPFSCQICSYTARTQHNLTVHLRTHTGDSPYVCYVCQSSFKVKSDLTRHLRVHNGEKPYHCERCDYRCAIKSNLKSHVATNHCKEKMQACNRCNFETSSRKRLAEHMSTHEEHRALEKAGKILKCHMCSYTCTNQTSLTKHKKNHSSSKPYHCGKCSYASTSSKSVKQHIRDKHPKGSGKNHSAVYVNKPIKRLSRPEVMRPKQLLPFGKKRFQCSKCDASFVREDSLGCHMRNHIETEKVMAMTVLELQNPFTLSPINSAVERDKILSEEQEGLESPVLGLKAAQPLYEDLTTGKACRMETSDENDSVSYSDANHDERAETADNVDRSSSGGDNESDRNTAVLSQAASHLLAFMENQQNHAMEDNMVNLARQRAMDSTNSSVNSTISRLNSASQRSGGSPYSARTGDFISEAVISNQTRSYGNQTFSSATQSVPTSSQSLANSGNANVIVRRVGGAMNNWDRAPTGLLSLAEQALDSDGDMLVSSTNSHQNTGSRSQLTDRDSRGSNLGSGEALPNASAHSSSQSSWEQLQQAVLHSVNLQSPNRRDSEEDLGMNANITLDSSQSSVPMPQRNDNTEQEFSFM